MTPISHELRVRYAECDLQGVVFNAQYLTYFDVGMVELLRAAFGSYGTVTARGLDMVVVEARVRYIAPARFDDLLRLEVGVIRLGNTSISTQHRLRRGDEVLAEGELHHVVVELASMAKAPMPDWFRQGLEEWALDPNEGPTGSSNRST